MRHQILSGLKWTAGARFGGQIITWAVTLLVMRLLSPEDYGLLAMATVFVMFMLMFSEAGLSPALIQKEVIDENALRQSFGFVIVSNLILILILNLCAPIIADFFGDDQLVLILRVLSLQFVFVMIGTIPGALLQRNLKFKSMSLIFLGTTILTSLLTLALAYAGYGVWSLVFGSIFSGACRAIIVNVVEPFHLLPKFSMQGMKSILFFGGNVTLSRLLWALYNQADIIIVGKLLGKEVLGFYSVGMHIASLPVQKVSGIVNHVALPIFSRMQHDQEEIRVSVIKAIRVLSFIAFPLLWGISSIANEFVLLFLGQKWHSAILPLQLLALVMPLKMIATFLPNAANAVGRPDVSVKNVILASIIMPIAFLIGVQWGIAGVAIAWVTVYPVVLAINAHRMLLVIGSQLFDLLRAISPAVFSTTIMYINVWGVRWLLEGSVDLLTKFIVMILIGALTYVGFAFLTNRKGYQEILTFMPSRGNT